MDDEDIALLESYQHAMLLYTLPAIMPTGPLIPIEETLHSKVKTIFYSKNGYFSGTSQYQFIAETYIVLALYGLISTGMVLMNERFSFFEELGIQKGLSLVVLVFGYLLSVFRMKYGGYPYSFLFR